MAAAGEALIVRTCERLLGRSVSAVHRINGGRNNQVFRVDCDGPAGPERYAAKHYFAATDDVRDRLGIEYGALRLLRAAGIGSIPAPVAVDRDARCAVYEFLPGTPAGLQPASDDEVRQAVAFLSELRRLARRSGVEVAAAASEACFSIAAVVAHVGARADLLRACQPDGPAADALHRFMAARLTPSIAALTAWTAAQVRSERLCADAELPLEERTLSPSDFGFHNAVRDERGRLAFVDFEYFGWDDPAKTIADFLLHPAMDVTVAQRRAFAAGVVALFAEDPRLEARGRILYPWFGLKWALILLNEFLPGPARRRRFAGDGEGDREQALLERLRRAAVILEHVDAACRHNPYFAS